MLLFLKNPFLQSCSTSLAGEGWAGGTLVKGKGGRREQQEVCTLRDYRASPYQQQGLHCGLKMLNIPVAVSKDRSGMAAPGRAKAVRNLAAKPLCRWVTRT